MTPLFSDKSISGDKTNLTENGEYVKTDMKTAEVFNSFFSNILKDLKIPQYSNFDPIAQNIEDPILKAIVKYKSHPNILTIQAKYKGKNKFSFIEVTTQDIEKEIFDLETKKETSQISYIPTKIIKENVDVFADVLCTSINSSIKSSLFPSCLKFADVTPLHKKGRKDAKQNYRPVSILPALSKLSEKSIVKQMSSFFEDIFSENQCGFRKGFSTQQCLLTLLGKLKNAADQGKMFGALLTDLSKAFDCLNYELLIAKLNAYGFTLPALKLIHNYL